jgi:hypothetical protein
MKDPLEHLHPDTAALIDAPKEVKIAHTNESFFAGYSVTEDHLEVLRAFLDIPRVPRMPCALILGDANSGKSSEIREFLRENEPVIRQGKASTDQPVVSLLSPPLACESRLYLSILQATNTPVPKSTPARNLQGQVETVLRALDTRMLIIDEFQHLSTGGRTQQITCLAALKNLSTRLRISIIGSGVPTAYMALSQDPQLSSRFIRLSIPRLSSGKDFQDLLATFISRVPLRNPSKLFTKTTMRTILGRTDGLVGELRELIRLAGIWAIKNNRDLIDEEVLSSCGYQGPGERSE